MSYLAMINAGVGDKGKFKKVLEAMRHRVFDPAAKGMRQHGKGRPLFQQPAFTVRKHCVGFFTGQAMKKIIEANEWTNDEADGVTSQQIASHQIDEYLDACIYTIFEILELAGQFDPKESCNCL